MRYVVTIDHEAGAVEFVARSTDMHPSALLSIKYQATLDRVSIRALDKYQFSFDGVTPETVPNFAGGVRIDDGFKLVTRDHGDAVFEIRQATHPAGGDCIQFLDGHGKVVESLETGEPLSIAPAFLLDKSATTALRFLKRAIATRGTLVEIFPASTRVVFAGQTDKWASVGEILADDLHASVRAAFQNRERLS